MKQELKPETFLGAVPSVMVSSGDMEASNILTIAWTGILNSEPPLVSISIRPSRYSYSIIKEKKEFVINLPGEDLVWATDFCGTKSGKQIDKFKEAKLTKIPANYIKAPMIKECPVNIECKVRQIEELGSHHMFIGEIVNINVDKEYLLDNGKIDTSKLKTLSYLGTEYCIADKKVGDRGICLK